MKDGFFRVASATPKIKIADCEYNTKNIISLALEASEKGASLVVFPELCITGYTCADLFFNTTLLNKAKESLLKIYKETKEKDIFIIVGLPIAHEENLYNCAAAIYHGEVLGFIPKANIPNYSLYSELRYFTHSNKNFTINFYGKNVPIRNDLVFCCNNIPEFKIGIEICEDIWAVNSPSHSLALNGATIIANLSASDEHTGKPQKRRDLIKVQSSKLNCAYIYSNAGDGESTTDKVYSGHNIIAQNGQVLKESELYTTGLIFTEVDLQLLGDIRRKNNVFLHSESCEKIYFDFPLKETSLSYNIKKNPFLAENDDELNCQSEEALMIQSAGLKKRLNFTKLNKVVIGVSGGLDSTLALLAAIRTFDILKIDRKNILCISMPCFGTSENTFNNAKLLCAELGVTFREIKIENTVLEHFKDIGQDIKKQDVTYENAQARERTQVLMDIANMEEAIVIGTGDLSELALGFMTYGGDHMSMYAINSGVPKTMAKVLINYEASRLGGNIKGILIKILNTPISPELIPSEDKESISQKTEDILGPYELHDFFIYYFILNGFSPEKIFRLAKIVFKGSYNDQEIKKWLDLFLKRFFTSQFKRSCLPDGPKVTEFSLSPRVNLSLPSDAGYEFLL